MLFPLTNFPPWIWSLTGWVGEFKTCFGGMEWLGSYVTGEKFESRCQVVAAEYTGLFQVWRRNISIPENIPTRQVSKSPSYQGKVQILHLQEAFCVKFSTPQLLKTVKYLWVARRAVKGERGRGGRGGVKLRIDECITARILMTWNGQMFSKYCSLCSRL